MYVQEDFIESFDVISRYRHSLPHVIFIIRSTSLDNKLVRICQPALQHEQASLPHQGGTTVTVLHQQCGLTSQVSLAIWARKPPLTSCSIESFPPPTEHKMDTSSSALHQPRKMFFNLFLQHFTARSDWKASLSTRSIEPGSATPPSTSSPSISTTTF